MRHVRIKSQFHVHVTHSSHAFMPWLHMSLNITSKLTLFRGLRVAYDRRVNCTSMWGRNQLALIFLVSNISFPLFCPSHSSHSSMYNGIGLSTARGSGTNGYVQKNASYIRPRTKRDDRRGRDDEDETPRLLRQPDQAIIEHSRKREIEIACLELRDALEEAGTDEQAVEEQVDALRQQLYQEYESAKSKGSDAFKSKR